jgi:hypothetical protein
LHIDDRLVRLETAKAELVARLVHRVLTNVAIGLDHRQRDLARQLVASELRSLSA